MARAYIEVLPPVSEEDGAATSSHDMSPRKMFAIKSSDYDQIADILDRAANAQQNRAQGSAGDADPVGDSFGLSTVLNDLLGIFGDIGTYGLLFKLAAFIKGRVDQMQDVEGNAKKLLKQATYIMNCFEKVEIRFTISHDVILEEAADTFCQCAALLQRIYHQDQSCQWFCGGKALRWVSRFCSAPGDQEQLLECIDKLKDFRQNLLVALATAPAAPALPLVEGPRFGIDSQIDELLQFFQHSEGGVTCVVCICGLKGVGKSRLMFEVMNKFPKSPIESFFTMDFIGAAERQQLQQELIQHLAGTATRISSIHVGKNLIKKYLELLKTKNRRVLLAFDNVDKAEDLTSILPKMLSEVLPSGSCVLISLANNATTAAVTEVEEIFPLVERKVHVVPPLSFQDAKQLFTAYARGEMPSEQDLCDDLVGRCDGLPLLLQLVASVGFTRANTWEDWQQVRQELTKVDTDIGQVKVAVQNIKYSSGDLEDGLSQTSSDKLLERLSSKLRVVYGRLDEELQEALSDIGNLFSGWDWQTVDCIFGTDKMNRLQRMSLVSSKLSNARGLNEIANLTRFSGPGPWKTKLVTMDGLLDASALNQYLYLRAIPADGTLKNVRSICLKDSEEPITGVMLDKAKSLRYLVLHNTKLKGSCVNPLSGLEFLYWGFDEGSEVKFPFSADILPQLKMLMINAQDLDLHSFQVPPAVVQLSLEGCSITEQAFDSILMSRKLEGLRIRKCKDLAYLSNLRRNSHLRKLCLEQCESPTLTKAVASLHQLTEIELLSCQNLDLLETGSIGALHRLRKLHIIGCRKLEKLPEDLKNLSQLTHLSFAFCSELRGDWKFITRMRNLEELILTGCSSLEKLPSHVGDLQNLEKVYLVACAKLEQLPEDIGRLERLQDLELDFCARLKTLPGSIAELACLQKLTLSGCSRLKELPPGLQRLPKLEYLNLLGCRSLAPPAKLIEDLRNKSVVVHVQETDLRTSYLRHRPEHIGDRHFQSDPTEGPPRESGNGFTSDQGPVHVIRATDPFASA